MGDGTGLRVVARFLAAQGAVAPYLEGFYDRHPGLKRYAPHRILDKTVGGGGSHPEARQHGEEVHIFPKFWVLDPATQDFVLAHEIGHYVKSNYGGVRFMEAAGRLGVELWDTDRLPYGQYNMDEAFADCFASYFLDPSELRSRYPGWFSLVEAIL